MNYQIDVTSTVPAAPVEPPAAVPVPLEITDLLKQLLEVQREHLAFQRAAAAAHDMTARWRTFLSRWDDEFPDLAAGCKKSLPHLERCYARMISELNDRLVDDDGVENDFALQEFLDRYGMRLAQLGTILNLVGPLAEAGAQNEASSG
jgi:hypothetical protein